MDACARDNYDVNNEKEEGLEKYVDITYVTPENADFTRTEGGILTLEFKDDKYERVYLYRSFPFSLEDEYISVRDEDGEEIGIIRNLSDFDYNTEKVLEKELEWVYYCPDIKAIYSVKEEFGYTYWDVETDQGRKEFIVRGRSNALTPLTETRYVLTDIDGNRFQISDITDLDKSSYKIIDTMI
mgnify:CR=1 FL=1